VNSVASGSLGAGDFSGGDRWTVWEVADAENPGKVFFKEAGVNQCAGTGERFKRGPQGFKETGQGG
jgi:hypothetical protein